MPSPPHRTTELATDSSIVTHLVHASPSSNVAESDWKAKAMAKPQPHAFQRVVGDHSCSEIEVVDSVVTEQSIWVLSAKRSHAFTPIMFTYISLTIWKPTNNSIAMATMKSQTSSSSSFTYERTYDVFISFRGKDTRSGFTGNLHKALCEKGVKAFMDDENLEPGAEITLALDKAIQESMIALVIFSKNYAESTFCLEELAKIVECSKEKDMFVLPVFYHMDPAEVRHHKKGSYAEALAKHEARNEKEKVEKWRAAMKKVANISGWHIKADTDRREYEFIDKIFQNISKKITSLGGGDKNQIFSNVDDKYIAQHDKVGIKKEHKEKEKIRKEKAEAHLDTSIRDSNNNKAKISYSVNDVRKKMSIEERLFARWVPPPRDYVKLNVAGSIKDISSNMVTGGLVRSVTGAWIVGFSSFDIPGEVLLAELWAIKNGLTVAWNIGLRKIKCETDAMEVVELLQKTSADRVDHEFALAINHILELRSRSWTVEISHVYYAANRCANFLARDLARNDLGLRLLEEVPPMMEAMVLTDQIGCTSVS